MIENVRDVCGSVRVAGNDSKSLWWNDERKTAVRRKEAAWKEVVATSNEEVKERCMEMYREEKRKVKRYIYHSKKKANEKFGKEMNEDVNENRKSFWKEMSNAN